MREREWNVRRERGRKRIAKGERVCARERVRRNGNSIKRKIAKFIAGHLQDN